MSSRKSFRLLSEEEIDLWRAVAKTVAARAGSSLPPHPVPSPRPAAPAKPEPVPSKPPIRVGYAAPYSPPVSRPVEHLPPVTPLERRYRRKVNRGQISIDRALDLHGLNQAEAHYTLRGFLRGAQADDLRLVLVVTGKGRARVSASDREDGGVLRRAVPLWLREPELRTVVLSVEEAGQPHGGTGALYIRLRRRTDRN